MKIRSLAWRLAPLIVALSCDKDVTSPHSRPAGPNGPMMAEAIGGISPQVNVGGFNSCTVNTVGAVRCWGRDNAGQTSVPADLPPVSQLSAGRYHTCAVKTDTMLVCWGGIGENAFGQATVPVDLASVSQVAASTLHTCALKTDGTVVCWGEDAIHVRVPLGLNSVSQISTATDHTCVLKTDRTVVCWGFNLNGQSTVPVDFPPVSQVSAGERYTCALLTSGALRCWGNNEHGQTNVPADLGSVTQISAGVSHACAVKSGGIVVCWGENGAGQSSVPIDLTSVLKVSAGSGHTCALRTDGSVVCWGFNGAGQINVPPGLDLIPNEPQTITFISVPPSPAIVGGTYTVAATGGGSGNSVSFSITGTESVCSVSGDVVTLLSVGSCTIAADQAGSSSYLAASQATQTFEIVDGQQLDFTSTAPSPAVVGMTYALSAQGGSSGSPITFSSLNETVCTVEGNTATLIQAGACIVAADQAGGNGYLAAAQASQTFTVADPQGQAINFTSIPPVPAVVGGTYTVTAVGGGSGNPVLFSSLTPSACFVIGNTVSLLTRATCRIAGAQAGNTYYLPAAQASQTFDIYETQSIALTSVPPVPAIVGGAYSITATGGLSGNPITFSSLSNDVCSVSGNTASLIGAGTCIIAADQAEGGGYLAAPRRTQSFTVAEPMTQTIAFTSTPPNPPIIGGTYVLSANGGGSGNPVTFSSLTPGICGISGAMASFNARGACTIAANQAGNAIYLAASQVTQSFVIDTRPNANAGSAQTGYEGSPVSFNGAGSSDADGDAITTYTWDFGDGTVQSVSSPTVQHVYNDNSATAYTVTLTVRDSRGATSLPATTSALIGNIAPIGSFVAPTPVGEGVMNLSLTGVQDASGDLSSLEYAFDCGDGSGFRAYAPSASFACTAADNGTRSVRARVKDKDGATSEYGRSVSVINVAPTIAIVSAPATGTVGVDYTIRYRFTDPGTTDSPWWYQINWGDGKKVGVNAATTQGATITQTYRYASPGTYTITVKVSDKDAGTATSILQVTITR